MQRPRWVLRFQVQMRQAMTQCHLYAQILVVNRLSRNHLNYAGNAMVVANVFRVMKLGSKVNKITN